MKKILFLLFAFIAIHIAVYGQTINTIAGGGSSLANGIAATAATIGFTPAIAIDAYGNLYIGDGNHNKVRKVDAATGIITTVAGTGVAGYNGDNIPATAAQLNGPGWVVFDQANNLYIGEAYSYRIRRVDAITGIITTYAGNGIFGYVSDGGLADTTEITNPMMTFDNIGNMYIGDNFRIRKVNTSGIITTIAGTGISGSSGDGGPATAATVNYETGICTDISGNVYFSDNNNYTIREIDISTGVINTIAGIAGAGVPYLGDGIPATASNINPFGIATDDTGNLYIADYGNNRIEKVDTFGIIHTIAGDGTPGFSGDNGPATTAEIHFPENVILDNCGNLYIADFDNERVRKVIFNSSPPVITISPSPGDTICNKYPVTLQSTVTAGTPVSYIWYVNGSAVTGATSSAYIYIPSNGDSVRCVLIGIGRCSGTLDTVSSNTINLVINNNPIRSTISLSGVYTALIGSLVTVTATVTSTGSSYTINWYNNGVFFNTTIVPMVTYTKTASTDNITATVIPSPIGLSPSCYDSTTSAVHTVTDSTTGIPFGMLTMTEVQIYPNPANDVLHIDISGAAGSSSGQAYRILSIVGVTLLQGTLQQGSNSISIQALPGGMYIVEVAGSDGGKTIAKIIKQ